MEGLWIGILAFAALMTVSNLWDAYEGWRAVAGTSEAWLIQARANLRREVVGLVIVLALIAIALPAIASPGEANLSLLLVVFMLAPIGMAVNSYLDRRTRRTLERIVADAA